MRKTRVHVLALAKSASGITLLETMFSCAILAVCLTTLGSLAGETLTFLRSNDVDSLLEIDGGRAMERLNDLLRKSGRVDFGGVSYPRSVAGKTALEFLVLRDLDGNGYEFDAATGELEWAPVVYAARVDVAGNFGIYDDQGVQVYPLGRSIRNLSFLTNAQNPALGLKEIEVTFEASRISPSGHEVVKEYIHNINMRN